jgi:tRNA-2-methylthio-N6-dimethylallyladenosine synthase
MLLTEILEIMVKYPNICNYIHLPLQSGSSSCLERMNRTYDRDWYLDRIEAIKRIIPNCAISADIIAGFCGETEEQHQDTLSLLDEVEFSFAYMYTYSERPKTLAERKYEDDVPEKTKSRRLTEIIDKQLKYALKVNQRQIGQIQEILVEGTSKKSQEQFVGRNSSNIKVVFPKSNFEKGMYVKVKIVDCTSATMIGELV